ncbi:MAG: glycosyltransferase, partial [Dehalococcoidia bacterium]|nr:glycosyltransferase [Dehalococcoidia bacterium]
MTRAAYITADMVGTPTGGGGVTQNESLALTEFAGGDRCVVLDAKDLSPAVYQQPDSVFLPDYFALWGTRGRPLDLAHFYSGTFSQTVHDLHQKGVRVTYTVPAHDRSRTVEEFHRLGLVYPYPHIADPSLWVWFSQGYREADVVIAPSQASAEFLQDEGCRDVRVIPHGHTPPAPDKVLPIGPQFAAGYLGQIGPDKGLVYLVRAWSELGDGQASLVIAGAGTDTLGSMISGSAGHGRFSLLGWLPDKSQLYNQVSVVVQPSVCESFGIEVLEAWSYGRPVIVSQGAGVWELVEEGVDGWVVPIRDPHAIAERLDWCRRHPVELRAMGEKGRQKSERYTW